MFNSSVLDFAMRPIGVCRPPISPAGSKDGCRPDYGRTTSATAPLYGRYRSLCGLSLVWYC